MFNIKLDTISEYVCDESVWPNAICNVMLEPCDEFIDIAKIAFGKEDGDGYIDCYAYIDPEKKIVTEFLIMFKDLDGSEDNLTIKVTSPADSVHYYKEFESQGGKEFEEFIADSCNYVSSARAEYLGGIIDIFDDFLEERGVRIPTSDEEMEAAGDVERDEKGNNINSARIYGTDYSILNDSIENYLGLSSYAASNN